MTLDESDDAPSKRRLTPTFLQLCCVLATLVTLWPGLVGELATSLRFQLGLACAAVAVIGFVRRRTAGAIVVALLALLHLTPELVLSIPARGCDEAGESLGIASVNVLTHTRDTEALAAWLVEIDVDVVAVIELSDARAQALAEELPDYVHTELAPREDNFGLGIYSRVPLLEAEVLDGDAWQTPPILRAVIDFDGAPVTLVVAHPFPPMSGEALESRDATLAAVAELAQPGPAIVVGDLNATSYARAFRRLLREADLRDSRRGFGRQGTWPVRFPTRVGIDHILTSDQLCVEERRRGPRLESDHLPVWARVRLTR